MLGKAVNSGKAVQKYLSHLLSACAYGLLFYSSVCGLDRDRTIAQLHHTAWTAKEGAPGSIRAIAQTNDGYLWLGTANGLYRFDGVQFETYLPRTGGDFPSNNIDSLLAARDGGLWIGYLSGGGGFLRNGNLTNYGEPEGLPPGRISEFAEDDEGTIWAATQGGLARFDGSRWQLIGSEWSYRGKTAQSVFVDKKGTLWVAAEETVMFLPKGSNSFQPTGEKIGRLTQITQSPDGAIWIAEGSRIVRRLPLQPGIKPLSFRPEAQVGSARILFDRDGALWVVSLGEGIRRVSYPDRFRGQKAVQLSIDAEIFTDEDGLSGNYIWTAFEDREGNIWTVTTTGLDRFRDSAVAPVRFTRGEKNFALAAGADGEVWILSKHLWVMPKRVSIPTRIRENDGGLSFFRDSEGTLWVDKNNFIRGIREDGSKVIEHSKPSKKRNVTQIFKDRGNQLWAYFESEGLFRLKDGAWQMFDRQSELPRFDPIVRVVDSLNRKWFGYGGNIITVIDGDRVRTFSGDDGLRAGDVKAIYERSGRVWAAGTLGVALFVEERFRTLIAEESEALSGVSGIVEARDGSLWLNARRGIIHIPADEVRTFLGDPAYPVRYRVFDFLDGLQGAAQQVTPFPTAVEGSDGRLWFSTSKGVALIDPQRIPKNNALPPVSIRSLTTDEKSYEPVPSLELPEGTTRLQISFTALSLSIPERVRFRYRLEGVDKEWQDSGTKREATYTNLGPGNYRFRVIACNNDGIWNEEGATLNFTIEPAFYQTVWFRAAVFFLVLLLVVVVLRLLYFRRISQTTKLINAAFEERLAERNRISHELHDTLLQGFFGVTMRLQAISNLLPRTAGEAKENLDNVLDQIDVVLEEGRRAILNVHSSSAVEYDLIHAFTRAGEDLTKTYQANFSLTIEGESRPLQPLVRDQIFRIGREALTNAFRHSKATKIEIEIEYASKLLRVSIRDNGCGINSDYLSEGREGHLGLSAMREYAEKIGAELKIWSREESGTDVELVVPRQIAFVKKSPGGLLKRLIRVRNSKEKNRVK